MNLPRKSVEIGSSQPSRPFTLSDDGYVRLTMEVLHATPLVHLISGVDENDAATGHEGAVLSPLSGYTEWVSATTPALTIGWDWQLRILHGCQHYARLGAPRSNIMLVNVQQQDLGPRKTIDRLEALIDSHAWWRECRDHICARYR